MSAHDATTRRPTPGWDTLASVAFEDGRRVGVETGTPNTAIHSVFEDNPRMDAVLRRHVDKARTMAERPGGMLVGAVGGSMAPALCPGQSVRVRCSGYLWPGQGICFVTRAEVLMVHRIVFELPVLGWVLQGGDGGQHVSAVPRDLVVGRAEVPWKPPRPGQLVAALRVMARAAVKRAMSPARPDWRTRPLRRL